MSARISNCVTDAVLSVQLATYTVLWLRRRPRKEAPGHKFAYAGFALVLIFSTLFTACGSSLHVLDPLPQEASPLWMGFILGCVGIGILYPPTLACALHPSLSPRLIAFCLLWLVVHAAHVPMALSGVDLSAWGVPSPPVVNLFGWDLDGRSIEGAKHNVTFDLLSSIPNMRGDGLFVHAILFNSASATSLAFLLAAKAYHAGRADKFDSKSVSSLTFSLIVMLVGAQVMIPMMILFGGTYAFDAWHISIFVAMAYGRAGMAGLILEPVKVAVE